MTVLAGINYHSSIAESIGRLRSVGFDDHTFQGYDPLLLWMHCPCWLLVAAVFYCGRSQVQINIRVFKCLSVLLTLASIVLVTAFGCEHMNCLWVTGIADRIADQARTIERSNDNYCRAACQGSDTSAAVLLRELKGCGADPQLGFNRVVTFESPLSPWCLYELNHSEVIATRGKHRDHVKWCTPFEQLGCTRDLPSVKSAFDYWYRDAFRSIVFTITAIVVLPDDFDRDDYYQRPP